jgi:class 3 adenylate cyclase
VDYRERTGVLLIADISGYTHYLERIPLAHAQTIVADLLEATIAGVGDPFEVVKIEGDAVFFAAGEEAAPFVHGAIRRGFTAFHDRLREVSASNTCRCRACLRARRLGMKFVAHYGSFGEHAVRGFNEVIGSDVVLVHRLLKNHVRLREYAALTDALVRRSDPGSPPHAIRSIETYDHLGEVPVWVWDLAAERAGRLIAPPA